MADDKKKKLEADIDDWAAALDEWDSNLDKLTTSHGNLRVVEAATAGTRHRVSLHAPDCPIGSGYGERRTAVRHGDRRQLPPG